MMATFLTEEEVFKLTGRCWKSKQIEHLRKRGIPFEIDASGHPVVATAVVEGSRQAPPQRKKQWVMPD